MKIRRSGFGEAGDAVQISHGETPRTQQPRSNATEIISQNDSVDVSGGRAMADQLSPATFAAERAEKVKRLAALVQANQYHPSSEAVAGAIAEEISLEILTAGGTADGGSE